MVPSIPAREALVWANSLVVSRSRLCFKAKYCSCGRIVTVRRVWRLEWVHSERDGHTWQPVVENLILITSLVRLSMAGVQRRLLCPSGHVACCCCQSMRKWSASKPVGSPLLPLMVPVLKPVYTRAGVELTSPQEGCKLAD